jgi:hypothetical protein
LEFATLKRREISLYLGRRQIVEYIRGRMRSRKGVSEVSRKIKKRGVLTPDDNIT